MRTVVKMKAARKRHHTLMKYLAVRLRSHQKSKILRSQGGQSANGSLEKEKTMMHWTVVFSE